MTLPTSVARDLMMMSLRATLLLEGAIAPLRHGESLCFILVMLIWGHMTIRLSRKQFMTPGGTKRLLGARKAGLAHSHPTW